jgi:hypothetical protein
MMPTATTAGFSITVRGRRVYLVDIEHHRDPGMSHHEAHELAQRLLCAAHAAERAARPNPDPPGGATAVEARRAPDRSSTPTDQGR